MIQLRALQHTFGTHTILDIPVWDLPQGEHCLLLGNSGSGKTTLLHLIAGLRRPSRGEIWVNGESITQMSDTQIDLFRGRNIGLVFQKSHLIPTLTVYQNLALAYYTIGAKIHRKRIAEILDVLGLHAHQHKYPAQLSQGQAQRTAVARAVLHQPKVLLADEPTASLDDDNATQVIQLLREQAHHCKASLLIATHDHRVRPHISHLLSL